MESQAPALCALEVFSVHAIGTGSDTLGPVIVVLGALLCMSMMVLVLTQALYHVHAICIRQTKGNRCSSHEGLEGTTTQSSPQKAL